MGQHTGTGNILAELSGVGDGVVHGCYAALVDEVNDQLHLVDALEVSVLRLIASLYQGLEAALHQVYHAAAQNGLLAEQVGLGLVMHGGFHDTGTGAADTGDVSQSDLEAVAGGILLHSHQAGHALAVDIQAANGMTRTLGSSHEHVYVCGRYDLLVADVEAVSKCDCLAGSQVGADVLLVDVGSALVVDQDHDDISSLGGVGNGHDGEAVLGRLVPGLSMTQTDDNIAAGISEVLCMGMTLRAVADDSDFLTIEDAQVAVLLIIHFCHNYIPP